MSRQGKYTVSQITVGAAVWERRQLGPRVPGLRARRGCGMVETQGHGGKVWFKGQGPWAPQGCPTCGLPTAPRLRHKRGVQ